MKKIYSYSEKKFSSFSKIKKLSILYEITEALESSWEDIKGRDDLLSSLHDCLSYASKKIKEIDLLNIYVVNFKDLIKLRDRLGTLLKKNIRDTDIFIKRYDKKPKERKQFDLVLVLDNLRSAFNVGSIIRTAECLGVRRVVLCGNCPPVDNRKVAETSMGAVEYIPIIHSFDIFLLIEVLKEEGYQVCALELTNNSISLNSYLPASKVALILGNESLGVSEEVINACDVSLEIPMHGWKNSLNVANATAIAAYSIISKMETYNDK